MYREAILKATYQIEAAVAQIRFLTDSLLRSKDTQSKIVDKFLKNEAREKIAVERYLMTQPGTDKTLLLLLRLSAFFCFAGWTWLHFYWEGPYGILLWRESTFAFADRLGISWEEFVGTGAEDGLVQRWIAGTGWLYFTWSILTLTVREKSWIQMGVILCGSVLLTILAYAKYLAALSQLPMFVEHGGQILSPIILVMALTRGVRDRTTIFTATLACVLTFAGHGAYALGFYWPTPANFQGMTSIILRSDHETTIGFLRVAGALDFVVCIGLFVPFLRRSSALYATVWGFLTALARPVAGMGLDLRDWGADQFVHEAVLRAPHFLLPLFLFIVWRKSKVPESSETLVAVSPCQSAA